MVEEGKTTDLDEDESSSLEEAPPTIEVKAAPMVEVAVEPEKETPKSNGPKFLIGLLVPVLVLLFLTNSSLFSAGAWDFNRRVEVTLYSDDDGVFRFDADPKTSHGIEESIYIIFIDPSYTHYSQVYRPEIHIGVIEHCEVESVNAVCMYHLKYTAEGEADVTKLGEYNQVNHTAEFVLSGEANESIVVRIDYYPRSGNALLRGGAASQPNDCRRGDWRRVPRPARLFSPEKRRVPPRGRRNFVDGDRRVCGAGLCAVRHRNAELHGLTNRAAA